MIIGVVIGLGFVVLLVAPTLHRRINANSRQRARSAKETRATELLNSKEGSSVRFDNGGDAARLRDRLLIRGVRSELVSQSSSTLVVFHRDDQEQVRAVTDELDSE